MGNKLSGDNTRTERCSDNCQLVGRTFNDTVMFDGVSSFSIELLLTYDTCKASWAFCGSFLGFFLSFLLNDAAYI